MAEEQHRLIRYEFRWETGEAAWFCSCGESGHRDGIAPGTGTARQLDEDFADHVSRAVSRGVLRYRPKPQERSAADDMLAAQFVYGAPPEPVLTVARKADKDAQVAVAGFGSDTVGIRRVLVVTWVRWSEDGPPDREYVVVPEGDYLTYSQRYVTLGVTEGHDLDQFYDRVETGDTVIAGPSIVSVSHRRGTGGSAGGAT